MKKIMTSNDLFKIFLVEKYDPDKNSITSYYELVEAPNTTVDVFETFSLAEHVMQERTEFWKTLIKKIPLYFEVRFIA
ncbi:MAG TPA: hypothetical protein VL995_01315 [Cellvibrio sp.]|nr:hypothetical protein [Cellvibrio sp.]